jgi:hypothetical protein
MLNRSLCRLAGVLLFALPFAVQAQQYRTGADIKTACEPMTMGFMASSRRLVVASEAWRVYASKWYYSSARTLEEARAQGFQAEVVIEGIPISAIWSDNQSRRSQARERWQREVSEADSRKDFMQLEEIRYDPAALEQYNRCVETLARSSQPLTCWFSDPMDRARSVLHVVLQPPFDMARQRVTAAPITNGFIFPDDMDSLRLSSSASTRARVQRLEEAYDAVARGQRINRAPDLARTSLSFPGPIRAGSFSFDIIRLDPAEATRARVQLANGMSCTAEIAPAPTVTAKVRIWPDARNWSEESVEYKYGRTTGCGKGESDHVQSFCHPNPEGRVLAIEQNVPTSLNCGSRVKSVEQGKPSANCVQVTAGLKGCGWDSLGLCKGRGWVHQRIVTKFALPAGSRAIPFSEFHDRRTNIVERVRYEYDRPLPADVVIDRWRYNVELTFSYSTGSRTFNLSDASPNASGCVSTASPPTDRLGYVQIACELPGDATARLISGNKLLTPDIKTLPGRAFVLSGQPADAIGVPSLADSKDGLTDGVKVQAISAGLISPSADKPKTEDPKSTLKSEPRRLRVPEITP